MIGNALGAWPYKNKGPTQGGAKNAFGGMVGTINSEKRRMTLKQMFGLEMTVGN